MSDIRISCADFTFPKLPHDLVLDLIAGLGLAGVDVSLIGGNAHLPVEDVLAQPSHWARHLSGMLHARGLDLSDVNFTPSGEFLRLALNHPDAAERRASADAFHGGLEFTARANGSHITLLPGIAWPSEDRESSLARSAEELAWRVEEGAKAGVSVSMEAHLGSIVPTPDAARRLLALVPGLTLTLDYTHFVRQGFSDSDCDSLVGFASHLHARGGAKGRLQTSMKDNAIDYARVLRTMREAGYSGYVALEYVYIEWERCNETDNLSETIILRDLLRACLGGHEVAALGVSQGAE